VVEDQEIVREMVKKILQRQGYTVLAAGCYRDCLELLDRPSTTSPDLLLTDIVLPDRDGRALADAVLNRRPHTRVLFMSGHSDDVITHRGVLEEGIAFIQKPFTPRSLSGKVREVLDDA
jgi:DNA-binding response OmpR family regulator